MSGPGSSARDGARRVPGVHREVGSRARRALVGRQEQGAVGDLLGLRAVYGFFPANSDGDDVILRGNGDTKFHFPRQQTKKTDDKPNYCLADFIAPGESTDHVAGFAVTSGVGLKELVEKYKADNDDYNAIMTEAPKEKPK